MLKISNVETFYGKIQALRGVNIDINKGEIVSLIGSNGAGKSTLLMAISGVNKAKTGEIIFEGNYRFDVFGKLTAIGDKKAVCPVAKNISGETPKNVVTLVNIIGLALTLPAFITAVILSCPSSRNFLMKSTIISESFTIIPDNASVPTIDKN